MDADVSLGMSIWGPEYLTEEEEEEEESVFLSAILVEQNRVRRGDLRENCARLSSKSVRFCARRVL